MKEQYKVIESTNIVLLADEVNRAISEGYFPIGGIATVHTDYGPRGSVAFYQAMLYNSQEI